MLDFERQSVGRIDAEARAEDLSNRMESFDHDKGVLEKRIADARSENSKLMKLLNVPKADAEAQVETKMQTNGAQTDLSYQYLESSDPMQSDPKRPERLHALKKASVFVDTPQAQRDFMVKTRSSVQG